MNIYDLAENNVTELNQALHNSNYQQQQFIVNNPNGKHNIAVGSLYENQVQINGHVGYYCAAMNQQSHMVIKGNAGPGLAENMMSGSVRVTGNASQYCGATAHSGLIVVEGDVAARCGISMKGVNIVVGGSIGHMSAFMAQSGRLVVCGDAGKDLGDSIYEAQIFVRGKVSSLGTDCVEKNMRDEHRQALQQLLEQAGVDYDVASFRRYGSARKLYNFEIDNTENY